VMRGDGGWNYIPGDDDVVVNMRRRRELKCEYRPSSDCVTEQAQPQLPSTNRRRQREVTCSVFLRRRFISWFYFRPCDMAGFWRVCKGTD
jgi:hypothetical protein